MTIKIGSFCSGVEAATLAFTPLGATTEYVAEIEPFPAAVLAERHGASAPRYLPDPKKARTVKEREDAILRAKAMLKVGKWNTWREPANGRLINYGDFTAIDPDELPAVDLLVAGTPCQGFSAAGLRGSLEDARGQLTLYFVKLAHELVKRGKIKGFLWENVPGVLATSDNAFGSFLGGIVGADGPLQGYDHGGRWPSCGMVEGPAGRAAWRILDAEYFGLPQRRKRVFLVADFAGWIDPAAVLFELASVRGNSETRPVTREGTARNPSQSPERGDCGLSGRSPPKSGLSPSDGLHAVVAGQYIGSAEGGAPDAPVLTASNLEKGVNNQTPLISQVVAFALRGREQGAVPEVHQSGDTIGTLRAGEGGSSRDYLALEYGTRTVVRRLTPLEAERCMGFPDFYTEIPYQGKPASKCPDGPRFKAIGNSKAVPVVQWIGRRIIASACELENRIHKQSTEKNVDQDQSLCC